MPTWGEILTELRQSAIAGGGNPDFDGVRRRYLAALHQQTRRNVIVYATDWLTTSIPGTQITLEDKQGLMEVCKDLHGSELDLILHSPGGSPTAAAALVDYLRTQFDDIRVFVPLAAMSAATMWALAANRIVMGKHSQLGPIDPQIPTRTGLLPARAIIEQFERAQKECATNPALVAAWVPILQQYGTGLIQLCHDAEVLSKRLVKEWLAKYMLAGQANAGQASQDIAEYFANYSLHQAHSLAINREDARRQGVLIDDLETDKALQDAVLSVHHATFHTFSGAAIKIVENHLGRAYVKLQQPTPQQALQIQLPGPGPGMPAQPPPGPAGPPQPGPGPPPQPPSPQQPAP